MIFVSANDNRKQEQSMTTKECWEEKKCAELIAKIRNSKYKINILDDAKWFLEEGFSHDVSLQKSWNYWK